MNASVVVVSRGPYSRFRGVLLVVATLVPISSFAQVTIRTGDAESGLTIVDPVSATYSTPYVSTNGSAYTGGVTVTPDATGDLSKGTYSDSISLSGSLTPFAGGSGAVAFYLPELTIQDSLRLVSPDGSPVPFTISATVTAVYGNGFADTLIESFGVGGNVVNGLGEQVCFGSGGGCGGLPVAAPSGTPYTFAASSTVDSGGELDFVFDTSGAVNYAVLGVPTNISGLLSLDPLIEIVVPDGTLVSSASGVFPVTFASTVPEPSSFALILAGLGAFGASIRRKNGLC